MKYLPDLFERNRRWAEEQIWHDPLFFERLCEIQTPRYLWIGCSDSRVPANQIVGLQSGELFVHRNIANIVVPGDSNGMAVVQYAVEVLGVGHIIVCGHYGCGGVRAAIDGGTAGAVDAWLRPLRALRERHDAELAAIADPAERWRRLCEISVRAQVRTLGETDVVARAWGAGKELSLHGWIYDLRDGLLRDLGVTVGRAEAEG
ncbi:MAG TPA: carbonic anhydrase [Thermoanaerobaculia bacterium]